MIPLTKSSGSTRATDWSRVWSMRSFGVAGGGFIHGDLISNRVSDPNLKIRAVGYINDDVFPDLVWQHQATGLLATWIMARPGTRFSVSCFHQTTFSTRTGTSLESRPREIQLVEAGFWAMVFPDSGAKAVFLMQKLR